MLTPPNFVERMRAGEVCVGTAITYYDPTVSEMLAETLDFLWIDMEHNALSLEAVQAHLIAAKGGKATPIVRVPWNDPVLIKPVLDIGAPGIVIPMIRTADDVRRAVAACKYPPEGVRGYGPRRPSNYARIGGPDFVKAENERILIIPQIEHIDAVNSIDEILAVPGVSALVVGANDLSGSMGLMGQPRHPDVLRAIDTLIAKCKQAGIPFGHACGSQPEIVSEWVNKGCNWLMIGNDYLLLLERAEYIASLIHTPSS